MRVLLAINGSAHSVGVNSGTKRGVTTWNSTRYTVFVLILTAGSLGAIAWAEIHSRRHHKPPEPRTILGPASPREAPVASPELAKES